MRVDRISHEEAYRGFIVTPTSVPGLRLSIQPNPGLYKKAAHIKRAFNKDLDNSIIRICICLYVYTSLYGPILRFE